VNKLKIVFLASTLLLIASCSNIPLTSMLKLMSLNPLETDPRQLLVAVRTPEGISVRDGDIVINFSFRTDDPSVSFDHSFDVIKNDAYELPADMTAELNNNEKITVMQLREEDAQIMAEGQQAIKAYREVHENGGAGSMNVRLVSACRNADFSWDNSALNVYLKTAADEDFFLFLEDMDVTKLDAETQDNIRSIPNCA